MDMNLGFDERADVSVVITRRMSAVPFDTRGQEMYIQSSLDADRIANKIKVALHQNYSVITAANQLLDGVEPIIEPLRWLGGDPQPQFVNESWFSSNAPDPHAGLRLSIRFGQARRMQSLSLAR